MNQSAPAKTGSAQQQEPQRPGSNIKDGWSTITLDTPDEVLSDDIESIVSDRLEWDDCKVHSSPATAKGQPLNQESKRKFSCKPILMKTDIKAGDTLLDRMKATMGNIIKVSVKQITREKVRKYIGKKAEPIRHNLALATDLTIKRSATESKSTSPSKHRLISGLTSVQNIHKFLNLGANEMKRG